MSDRLLQAFFWLFAIRKAPEWLSIAVADTSPVQPVTFRLNAAAVLYPITETPALTQVCVRRGSSKVHCLTSERGFRFRHSRLNGSIDFVMRDSATRVDTNPAKTEQIYNVMSFAPKTLNQRIERVAQSSPCSNNPPETVSP